MITELDARIYSEMMLRELYGTQDDRYEPPLASLIIEARGDESKGGMVLQLSIERCHCGRSRYLNPTDKCEGCGAFFPADLSEAVRFDTVTVSWNFHSPQPTTRWRRFWQGFLSGAVEVGRTMIRPQPRF